MRHILTLLLLCGFATGQICVKNGYAGYCPAVPKVPPVHSYEVETDHRDLGPFEPELGVATLMKQNPAPMAGCGAPRLWSNRDIYALPTGKIIGFLTYHKERP